MMPVNLIAPQEMQLIIAKAARAKRLDLNLSQQTLSERSGVSYSVIKKFERTGQISLESLIKLALCLGAMEPFTSLFPPKTPESALTLDELMQDRTRQRGRK